MFARVLNKGYEKLYNYAQPYLEKAGMEELLPMPIASTIAPVSSIQSCFSPEAFIEPPEEGKKKKKRKKGERVGVSVRWCKCPNCSKTIGTDLGLENKVRAQMLEATLVSAQDRLKSWRECASVPEKCDGSLVTTTTDTKIALLAASIANHSVQVKPPVPASWVKNPFAQKSKTNINQELVEQVLNHVLHFSCFRQNPERIQSLSGLLFVIFSNPNVGFEDGVKLAETYLMRSRADLDIEQIVLFFAPDSPEQEVQSISESLGTKLIDSCLAEVYPPETCAGLVGPLLLGGRELLFQIAAFTVWKCLDRTTKDYSSITSEFPDANSLLKAVLDAFPVQGHEHDEEETGSTAAPSGAKEKFDWIGFDLDLTLVEFNPPLMHQIIYDAVIQHLSESKANAKELSKIKLHAPNSPYAKLLKKGFVLDKSSVYIIQLDSEERIVYGYKGLEPLTPEEMIRAGYLDADTMERRKIKVRNSGSSHLSCLYTNFEMPIAPVLGAVFSLLSKEEVNSIDMRTRMLKAITNSFLFAQSKFCTYGFESHLVKEGRKIVKKQTAMKRWLEKGNQQGQKFFIVTNASWEHADLSMRLAYGTSWRKLFKLVLTNASKRTFFSSKENEDPILQPDTGIYRGGKASGLEKVLKTLSEASLPAQMQMPGPLKAKESNLDVLYLGDHLNQDVILPTQHFSWNCATVSSCANGCLFEDPATQGRKKSMLGEWISSNACFQICEIEKIETVVEFTKRSAIGKMRNTTTSLMSSALDQSSNKVEIIPEGPIESEKECGEEDKVKAGKGENPTPETNAKSTDEGGVETAAQ